MTNEQLQILLLNIAARLEAEIEKADDQIENEERHQEYEYIGRGFMWPIRTKENENLFKTVEGDVIALDGLKVLLDDIKNQADLLLRVVTLS